MRGRNRSIGRAAQARCRRGHLSQNLSTLWDRLLEATYRVEQQHFWWKGLRGFVRPLVADALSGRPGPRILDCGCGTGANLVMLGEFGHASGFDLTFRGLEKNSTSSGSKTSSTACTPPW